MTRRLPPRPADTIVARFVLRQVNRLHRARRWAVNNSPLVRRSTYAALSARHTKLCSDYLMLSENHRALITDYRKIIVSMPSGVESARYRLDMARPDPVHVTTVHFLPLNVASAQRHVRREELSDYTVHVLREHARSIARKHSEQIEREILDMTAPQAKLGGRADGL